MFAMPPPAAPVAYVVSADQPASAAPAQPQAADDTATPPPVPQAPPADRVVTPQGTTGGAPAKQPHLFGDWGGLRSKLIDLGITPDLQYFWEPAYNLNGGSKSQVEQVGQLNIGATLDLDKIVGLKGGTFQLLITNRNGGILSDENNLGLLQNAQAFYGGGKVWRLAQAWYRQELGPVEIKLGRASMGEDFATMPCFFESLYFCGPAIQNVAPYAWINPPIATWAARARVSDKFGYTQVGVYEKNPNDFPLNRGFFLGFKGATGVLIPMERAFTVNLGGDPGRAGIYKIGAWYDTSKTTDLVHDVRGGYAALTGEPLAQQHGRWGGYVTGVQQVIAADSDGRGGLSMNLTGTWTDKRTTMITNRYTLMAIYSGPLAARPTDEFGIGVGRSHVNGNLAHLESLEAVDPTIVDPGGPQHNEYAIEAMYSIHAAPGLSIAPNAQWYIDPGGRSSRNTITVLGAAIYLSL